MNNSPFVESYFAQKHSEDLYSLTFNTTERWMPFHAYNDTMFIFGEEPENEKQEEWEARIQNIEPFLPEDKSFLTSVCQEKDQITFYYIAMDLLSDKTRDTLVYVKLKEHG